MSDDEIKREWVACGICYGSGWEHLTYPTECEKETYGTTTGCSVVPCKCANAFGLAKFVDGIDNVAQNHRGNVRGSGYQPREIIF